MTQPENEIRKNPWKIATLSILAVVATAFASGIVLAKVQESRESDVTQESADSSPSETQLLTEAAESPPPPSPSPVTPESTRSQPADREDCERYAWATQRNNKRVVRDGVVGGAIGAGLGAAGGAIADGGDGAGKGAGIGALVGVAAGSLYGLDKEQGKVERARADYEECLARQY
jgi:hypothetical protein